MGLTTGEIEHTRFGVYRNVGNAKIEKKIPKVIKSLFEEKMQRKSEKLVCSVYRETDGGCGWRL